MTGLDFSIVIPTYNRPDRLRLCLAAISQLNYPFDRFEVIVVDDGSPTLLHPIVEPFQAQLQLTLLRQVNAGPASARNAGAMLAKGEFLVFTDDDCTPTPTWLTAFQAQFGITPTDLLGGQTLNALPQNLCSTASQILIDYLYGYYNRNDRTAHFFASNNFALPTALFRVLGGFNTAFPLAAGEDREFCDRWLHQGYAMTYVPQAQIYHAHRLNLQTFWRQHFNYGRGAFCFHQLRSQRYQETIKVEALPFYLNLLTYPFLTASPIVAPLLSSLLLLSQIANVMGFVWERQHSLSALT
ncbi:MAG: glycosyltransferase [Elainella sp. Prado103]|jgi:glycosyltransferase involved in cell wall biosynthesis|nr:glycosyltransferase [Elainella sp. Prado103]